MIADAPVPILDQYGVWHVLWSMHSPLSELQSLCKWVRPTRVEAICKSLVDECPLPNLSHFIMNELCDSPVNEVCDDLPYEASASLREDAMDVRRFFTSRAMPDDTLTDLLADTVPVHAQAVTSSTARSLRRAPSSAPATEIDSHSDSECSSTIADSQLTTSPPSRPRSLQAHSSMDSSDFSMPTFLPRKRRRLTRHD